MDAELQSYLDSCRMEGVLDSSGQFSLDLGKARRKLGSFFGKAGQDCRHYALRAALACLPDRLRLLESAAGLTLEFDGTPPLMEDLRSLFGRASLTMRAFQMAVVGALEQGGPEVHLHIGDQRLSYTAEGERLVKLPPSPSPLPHRLTIQLASSGLKRWWRGGSGMGRLLAADFNWCLTPIETDQGPWQPPGLNALHWMVGNRRLPPLSPPTKCWPAATGPPMAAGLHAHKLPIARISWLCQGATIVETTDPSLPPYLQLVVDLPFPFDLSLRAVDSNWEAPTERLAAPAAALLLRGFLEAPDWLGIRSRYLVDWILEVLMRLDRLDLAKALADRAVESGLRDADLGTAVLLERLNFLGSRLEQPPTWQVQVRQRSFQAWQEIVGNSRARTDWKRLSGSGWPYCKSCPQLTAAVSNLPMSLVVVFLRTWIRDSSSLSQSPSDSLLPQLCNGLERGGVFWPLRNDARVALLLARELLAPGARQLAQGRQLPLMEKVLATLVQDLDSSVAGYGHALCVDLARRALEQVHWDLADLKDVVTAVTSQSPMLNALTHEGVDHSYERGHLEGLRSYFRFLYGLALYRTGQSSEAERELTRLATALRQLPVRHRERLRLYQSGLQQLLTEFGHHDLALEVSEMKAPSTPIW